MNEVNLLYEAETFAIRGAVIEVSREMGVGFLEAVYQECLTKEFIRQGIPASAHLELRLPYKGEPLLQTFRPDFICYDKVILEIKHVKSLTDNHRAQVLNYLRATGFKVGLLVNFGCHPKAQIERFVL